MSLLVRPAIAGISGTLVFGLFFGSPFIGIWVMAWAALGAGARHYGLERRTALSVNTRQMLALLAPLLVAGLGYLIIRSFFDCPRESILLEKPLTPSLCRASVFLDIVLYCSIANVVFISSIYDIFKIPIKERKLPKQIISFLFCIFSTLAAIFLMQEIWIVADGRRSLLVNVKYIPGLIAQSFSLSLLVLLCGLAAMSGLVSIVETLTKRKIP